MSTDMHRPNASWPKIDPSLLVSVAAGRLLGLLHAIGAGFSFHTLRELRGPEWLLQTFYLAGLEILLATIHMLLASWLAKGSQWAAIVAVPFGFFTSLLAFAFATGRLIPPADITAPVWAYYLAASLSLLLSLTALPRLIPAKKIPDGFGPILPS